MSRVLSTTCLDWGGSTRPEKDAAVWEWVDVGVWGYTTPILPARKTVRPCIILVESKSRLNTASRNTDVHPSTQLTFRCLKRGGRWKIWKRLSDYIHV